MIRIDRGTEPVTLAATRKKALAKATLAWVAKAKVNHDGYRVIAWDLYEYVQHRKCAWCERACGWWNQPLEHYRPKGGADDGDVDARTVTSTADAHYWWLAWTWSNLLFACARCNGPATKANWFPLEAGGTRVAAPSRTAHLNIPGNSLALATENALMIDPASEDPMQSIVWLPLQPLPARWEDLNWRPQHLDERGRVTIKVLRLDGEDSADVSGYIRTHVRPKAVAIAEAIAVNDRRSLNSTLDQLQELFSPTQPFLAAVFDAWEWFRAQPELARLPSMSTMTISRPGALSSTGGDLPLPPDHPTAATLSPGLLLRLRAEDFSNVDDAVLSLSAEGIKDQSTLQQLLDYDPIYLKGAIARRDAVVGMFPAHTSIEVADAAAACSLDAKAASNLLGLMVEVGLLERAGTGFRLGSK